MRIFVLLYVAYLGVIFAGQRRLVFPGSAYEAQVWTPRSDVDVWTRSIDAGEVEAFFFAHPSASPSSPAPLLVYSHGNGGSIDASVPTAEVYRKMGFSVLIPEYRGYGRSAGSPSEEGIAEDVVWFVEQAVSRDDVDGMRVVYHGISLGGGVAAAVARRRPPQAMVLQSTFTSIRGFAARYGAPSFLVRDPFDTREVVAELDVPILILHGTRDEVVAYAMGEELAATARNAKLETFEAGHAMPTPADTQRFWSAIADFMRASGLLKK